VDFQPVSRRIEELADESIDFLLRMCSIPALGPENQGPGEMVKYLAVKEHVLALKPDRVEEVFAPDDRVPDKVRPNLLAIFFGRDRSRTVWILSHVDVVPPGELGLWDSDPFKPYRKENLLFGRGLEDNGQALAASMFAARAVKETCGFGPNVGLAIVSDEECGSLYGLDYVLKNRPELFSPDDLIVVPDAGTEFGDEIEIAEKHLLHVKFVVRGVQTHASRPDRGRNTLRAAAHFIVDLDNALRTRFSQTNPFFNPPVSTFEPTRKDANVPNINTIPGEDVFFFDCRVLPEVRLSEVIEEMERVALTIQDRFGVECEVSVHLAFEAPEPTPPDAPVVIALAQAIQEVYGVQARPVGIGGQTVAAFFRRQGLRAAVWERILHTAHCPNEHIAVEHLLGDTKVFAKLMV
jgi:succinyl-diaminopimelate desuccinylase